MTWNEDRNKECLDLGRVFYMLGNGYKVDDIATELGIRKRTIIKALLNAAEILDEYFDEN